jgi:hypothetical protein
MTTRARKELFIRSWGEDAVKVEINAAIRRYGLALFSDEVILEIVRSLIGKERLRLRMIRDNRAFLSDRYGSIAS